jgi:hypothetical protein
MKALLFSFLTGSSVVEPIASGRHVWRQRRK